jgi:hypothetical protein
VRAFLRLQVRKLGVGVIPRARAAAQQKLDHFQVAALDRQVQRRAATFAAAAVFVPPERHWRGGVELAFLHQLLHRFFVALRAGNPKRLKRKYSVTAKYEYI